MPPQPPQNVILEADFDIEALIKYHWTSLGFIALFIVTIPFVIIGAIIYWILLPRIVANWSAQLTDRALIVRKGVFTKVEKTIPLEKITDLSSTQGPVMRLFDLKQLGVETAGQSGAAGTSLVTLLGIRGTDDFRTRVLAQRDAITSGAPVAPPPRAAPPLRRHRPAANSPTSPRRCEGSRRRSTAWRTTAPPTEAAAV